VSNDAAVFAGELIMRVTRDGVTRKLLLGSVAITDHANDFNTTCRSVAAEVRRVADLVDPDVPMAETSLIPGTPSGGETGE
jgi:hypothetical protein